MILIGLQANNILYHISPSGASGSFSSADLSQIKDGMARVTGKVRIKIMDQTSVQSRSQSPLYPAAGMGNRILGLPVLTTHVFDSMFQQRDAKILGLRFYCACQAEHFIPEVVVAHSCCWIRVTRTLGTRLTSVSIFA